MTAEASIGTPPLAGLRVVELAGLGPAPFAAMMLADLGAEVIRVDRPGTTAVPSLQGGYDVLARGRRSVIVDLKDARGAQVVGDLAARSDVLLEGFRPGVAERLGIGPEVCLARNPRLVYGRMTGWGQDGPLAGTAGHDITYIAVTGALSAIGRAGGPPQPPVNLLGDFGGGGMFLVVGVLAALWERERSGRGQVVDAAIVDGTATLTAMLHGLRAAGLWRTERGTNLLDTGAPFYDVYETADGGWMAVGALEPQFFAELCRVLELPDAPAQFDQARWPDLRAQIAGRFAQRSRAEWTRRFAGTDACVAPVLSFEEAPHHPQLQARESYVERDGVTQPAPAPRFSRSGLPEQRPPCPPGSNTREVLEEFGVADVDGLITAGVVREA